MGGDVAAENGRHVKQGNAYLSLVNTLRVMERIR